jgi:sugar phosphate isomerase/epimerase
MKKNTTTRRTFLRNVSSAAAVSVVPAAAMALDTKPVAEYPANDRKGPKRGVSLYSYSAEFGLTKTLEDCFEDIHDMGATGIEILANAHIENYPYPTDQWLDYWWSLCWKYNIEPAEYGHWIDGRVLQDRELTVAETTEYLVRDMRLAHRMGFKWLRTKVTVKDNQLAPIDNWTEVIDSVLPLAERLDLKLLPEIHSPSKLSSGFIMHYLDYIKRTGTKHFGLNIDFGVFNTNVRGGSTVTQPEELIPLIPYVYCCHAKFVNMDDNFRETQIPYDRILKILIDNGYDGYLLSEYEGSDKYEDGYEVTYQLRKHHIMMKKILGY